MEIDANKKGRIAALMEEIHGIHFVNSLYWRLGETSTSKERAEYRCRLDRSLYLQLRYVAAQSGLLG
jgi:hypothetical protein